MPPQTQEILPWTRYPRSRSEVTIAADAENVAQHLSEDRPTLPFGFGRSLGDCCLNDGGRLLAMHRLNRILHFDRERGLLSCEAGTSLEEILDLVVPAGWILPVVPGFKEVTCGGAIANDVHGKNHHRQGTFGGHVTRLDLIRSDRPPLTCSPLENADLFNATIGGLGLTGIISRAELALERCPAPLFTVTEERFRSLPEAFALFQSHHAQYDQAVAWLDAARLQRNRGRGVFSAGRQSLSGEVRNKVAARKPASFSIPARLPGGILNPATIAIYNQLRFQGCRKRERLVHYESCFFPLHRFRHWNRLYGERGYLQYQFLIPDRDAAEVFDAVFEMIAVSGQPVYLAVLKRFGDRRSPGMLSFPSEGWTLALDFPNRGKPLLSLLDKLDAAVLEAGGRLYPAKDARMSPAVFRGSFARLDEWLPHKDPRLDSSFWRRVAPPSTA